MKEAFISSSETCLAQVTLLRSFTSYYLPLALELIEANLVPLLVWAASAAAIQSHVGEAATRTFRTRFGR
jgi:hypothetical protein